jgi:type III secretion protein HrpB1
MITKHNVACPPVAVKISLRYQNTQKGLPKTLKRVGNFLINQNIILMNTLIFRTAVGSVSTPVGTSKHLGEVDVTKYEKIRVVADERVGSGSGVTIRLTITEGNELVAQLDVLHLAPHAQITKMYEVPGRKLNIYMDALPGAGKGTDSVDVLIYGWAV